MVAAAMAVIIFNRAGVVDAVTTIPSSVSIAAAKTSSPPLPSPLLPSTTTAIAAINDCHHRCCTVNSQWRWWYLMMATATVRADVGKGGQQRKCEGG
jgi:hypothetical protein